MANAKSAPSPATAVHFSIAARPKVATSAFRNAAASPWLFSINWGTVSFSAAGRTSAARMRITGRRKRDLLQTGTVSQSGRSFGRDRSLRGEPGPEKRSRRGNAQILVEASGVDLGELGILGRKIVEREHGIR